MKSSQAVVIAALAVVATVGAQDVARDGTIGADDPRFDRARAEIRKVIEEEKLPSVSVAVAKDGKVIWQQAFGYANVERKIAATPHTPYSLASISKPITATGLLRLVEQKKVDLDRPANDYLGAGKLTGLTGDAQLATVRRVLSHSSGLPLHYQFFYENEPFTAPSADDTITRYGILVYPPGTVYQYSNLGYGILDSIISRVSGRPYADYMRTEVFEPLGMADSSVHVAPALRDRVAQRYTAEGQPIPYYGFDHDGGSAVYASAHDLVRFGMYHLGAAVPGQKPVLSDATRTSMRSVETPSGSGDQYGLGWFIGEESAMRRVWHTGSMPGVVTILNLYPDNDLVTLVLINNPNASARSRIAQVLLAPHRPSQPINIVRADNAPQRQPTARPPFTPTPEQLGEWTGVLKTWDRRIPFTMRVEPDGDIKISLGMFWTLLNAVSWNGDRLTGRFVERIPTPDAGRHSHNIALDLRLRDGKLSGSATAQTNTQPMHFALSSYVELSRQKAGSQR